MKKYISRYLLLLLAYLVVIFLPNFGAVDRVNFQWLYLTILNLSSLIIISKEFNNRERFVFNYYVTPLNIFFILFIFGAFSILFSPNKVLTIIELSRWLNYLVALFVFSEIIPRIHNFREIITYLFLACLVIEVSFIYYSYESLTIFTRYDFSQANLLKGFSSNKNIAAASISIKTPLILYLILKTKNTLYKVLTGILLFVIYYCIFLLSARAMFIAIGSINILVLSYIAINKTFDINAKLKNIITILSPLVLVLIMSLIKFGPESDLNVINRATTLETGDSSVAQRIRFYKHGINHILENPFIPSGLSNWKILSAQYDKDNIEGYILPYHLHNDYLQIGAELGIIAMLLYLLFLIHPMIKSFFNGFNNLFLFTISLSILVYFIDSSLNFPLARPMVTIPFLLLISFVYTQQHESKN